MTAPTTIAEQIAATALAGVASSSNGKESASAMSIDDMIKAAAYAASATAATRNHLGLRFRKIIPGGCG